ncbi:MAG: phosphopantothenoylcysteine decarboxylase [Phycisphaerae bacterium]
MNLLVSAGPTREYFDSVRFISNASSGKMGYAIAAEAARRGHRVTLVSGPVGLDPPAGVRVVRVTTAAEMADACKRAFRLADAAIMTAAVCDYRPARRLAYKRPKQRRPFRAVLEPTEDIAAALGRRKGRRLLVGFAMEDHDPKPHAERKLKQKRCDLIVLNGPDNVGGDRAVVELYAPTTGWSGPFRGSKHRIARQLIREIERMWKPASGPGPRPRLGSKSAS